MRVEVQLSAFLENKVGVLAALATDLGRHKVSIRALTVTTLADHALVRFVVSDPRKALHLLGERGVLAVTSRVLAIELPDTAGALAAVCQRLARARINVDYAYGSGPARAGSPAVVYAHVSDLKSARAALASAPRRRRRR